MRPLEAGERIYAPLTLFPPQEVPAYRDRGLSRSVRRERKGMFAGCAVAAGEVEVRAELTHLAAHLRAQQPQPVGLEELPQVDIGQRAGVARVARPFEAV